MDENMWRVLNLAWSVGVEVVDYCVESAWFKGGVVWIMITNHDEHIVFVG